ncbi:MAG: TolC family protein [Tenuifilaceae bacterium]|nr:TolC family protein [Tenuifilaceae bacterium]
MNRVINNNLEYAVERFNVNISNARVEAARIFQDPTIALDWAGNKEGRSINDYSLSTELSKTFELGGKRKARINLAKSESALTTALLANYLRNLQADATIDYLTAIAHNYLYKVNQSSYQMMKELSTADSIRLSLGSIMAIDAAQSKIEARVIQNELIQSYAERENALFLLSMKTSSDSLFWPSGELDNPERLFALPDLLTNALNNRADLLTAKENINYSQKALTLTKRERVMDIDLKIGASNSYVKSGGFSPEGTEVFAGIAIPLKFSNLNKSEVKIVQFELEQSELLFKQVEIQIQSEVKQAYNQYLSLLRQLDNYNKGLLEEAKMVLDGKTYSYSRGENSLLEVLNAQRTYNEIQTSYYETLYKCYVALVELERAVGFWDIDI